MSLRISLRSVSPQRLLFLWSSYCFDKCSLPIKSASENVLLRASVKSLIGHWFKYYLRRTSGEKKDFGPHSPSSALPHDKKSKKKKKFYTWLRGKFWCIDDSKMQQSATETDLANKPRCTWNQWLKGPIKKDKNIRSVWSSVETLTFLWLTHETNVNVISPLRFLHRFFTAPRFDRRLL